MKANQEASTAIRTRSIIVISKAVLLLSVAAGLAAESLEGRQSSTLIPGVVIDHSPAASGLYIGSPSIVILTNGDYVASHDFFGPKSKEFERAVTVIFRSTDRGNTWKKVSEIHGAFWSSLFVHRGALYLLEPCHEDIFRTSDLLQPTDFGGGLTSNLISDCEAGITWSE